MLMVVHIMMQHFQNMIFGNLLPIAWEIGEEGCGGGILVGREGTGWGGVFDI
jgi:hypothetical protein